MADAVDKISDPLAKWGTPEFADFMASVGDEILIELGRMTKQAEQTGGDGRNLNAINQLLNGLALIITKFKLVRENELQSGNAVRVDRVTTFFTPTISALESSEENFIVDRNTILRKYRREQKGF
ncbi:hypothetical protein IFR05_015944 [Cadophora sp. M221]|nr:hypothetical protein IFR05_015944 [Cadophora sp. M221]